MNSLHEFSRASGPWPAFVLPILLCLAAEARPGETVREVSQRVAERVSDSRPEMKQRIRHLVEHVLQDRADLSDWSAMEIAAFESGLTYDLQEALIPDRSAGELEDLLGQMQKSLRQRVAKLPRDRLAMDWSRERERLDSQLKSLRQRILKEYETRPVLYCDMSLAKAMTGRGEPRALFLARLDQSLSTSASRLLPACGSLWCLTEWRVPSEIGDAGLDGCVSRATQPFLVDGVAVFTFEELDIAMNSSLTSLVIDWTQPPRAGSGAKRLETFWSDIEGPIRGFAGAVGTIPRDWSERLGRPPVKVAPETPSPDAIRHASKIQQALRCWTGEIDSRVRTAHPLDGAVLVERWRRFEESVHRLREFGGDVDRDRPDGDELDQQTWKTLKLSQPHLTLFTNLDGAEAERVAEFREMLDRGKYAVEPDPLEAALLDLIAKLTEWTNRTAAARFTAQDHRDEHFRSAAQYMLTLLGIRMQMRGVPRSGDTHEKLVKVYLRLHERKLLVEKPMDVDRKLAALTPFERECYDYVRSIAKVNPLFENLDESLQMNDILKILQPYERQGIAPEEAQWRKRIEAGVLSYKPPSESAKPTEPKVPTSSLERSVPDAVRKVESAPPAACADFVSSIIRGLGAVALLLCSAVGAGLVAWFRQRRAIR